MGAKFFAFIERSVYGGFRIRKEAFSLDFR